LPSRYAPRSQILLEFARPIPHQRRNVCRILLSEDPLGRVSNLSLGFCHHAVLWKVDSFASTFCQNNKCHVLCLTPELLILSSRFLVNMLLHPETLDTQNTCVQRAHPDPFIVPCSRFGLVSQESPSDESVKGDEPSFRPAINLRSSPRSGVCRNFSPSLSMYLR